MKRLLFALPLLLLLSCKSLIQEDYLKVDNLEYLEGSVLKLTTTHGNIYYAVGEKDRVNAIYAVLRIANNSNSTVLITYTPDDHHIRSVDILGD